VKAHAIFIHGLGGDLHGTWRCGLNPNESWLPWLAEDIAELAVWAVGYEAPISRFQGHAMHLAVLANDTELSDLVAGTWLDRARIGLNREALHEAVFRLIECAAANPDRVAARNALAQRLETLAFILPPTELSADLVDLLESLEHVDTDMAGLLGRAVHTAKLALPRSAAA
jgi:hypothetical protein